MITGISPDLPHTGHFPVGRSWTARLLKPVFVLGLRSWWRIRLHHPEYVPRTGPVILAANHIGVLDGPILVGMTQRLTFALIKHEMFAGAVGRLLAHFGQIPINRRAIDTKGIGRSIQVLRSNKVLAVFPEGVRADGEVHWARGGAVYFAMVTGAPIVPVALLGTRDPGRTTDELPHRGATLHVVYGPPMHLPRSPWPRRKAVVAELTEQLRRRLAAHVLAAQEETGLPLPGPPKPKVRTAAPR